MKGWQFIVIAVPSIIIGGMVTELALGSKALLGMVVGIILWTWIMALYDKLVEAKK